MSNTVILTKRIDRSLRLSSKEDQDMGPAKIRSIMENNKLFPHLYDPYYERKDIKANLMSILKSEEAKSMGQDRSNPYSDYGESNLKIVRMKDKLEGSNKFGKKRFSMGLPDKSTTESTFKHRNSSLSTKLTKYAP